MKYENFVHFYQNLKSSKLTDANTMERAKTKKMLFNSAQIKKYKNNASLLLLLEKAFYG